MSVRVDATMFNARMDAARRAMLPAQRALLHQLAAKAATNFAQIAPYDTNRYAASLLDAFRQAGVDGPAPPALEMSEYRMIQRHQLERQIKVIWQKLLSTREGIRNLTRALDKCGYTSRGRPLDVQGHKWNSRLLTLKALEPAYQKLHLLAIEHLNRFNSHKFAIVFGVGRGAIHRAIAGDAKNEASRVEPLIEEIIRKGGRVALKGVKLVVTVRQGVNGGHGVSAVVNGDPAIVIRSMEPHARILERRRGVMTTAMADARTSGISRLKRDFVVEVAKASGLKTGAA